MEGCRVTVYQHFDDTITIGFGHQQLGKYSADGLPFKRAVNKNGQAELKRRRAALVQPQQTGHLMC